MEQARFADYEEVSNKEDFVEYLILLRRDLERLGEPESDISSSDYWKNTTLDSYLESMSFWVENRMHDFLQREGVSVPEDFDWKLIARILYAAAVYE